MSVFEKKYLREKAKVAILEQLIEDKARELYLANVRTLLVNRQLSKLYEVMPSAMLVLDHMGKIERANPATQTLLGYTEETLLTMTVDQICVDLYTKIMDNTNCIISEQTEGSWQAADGNAIPVLISISAMQVGDDGNVSYIIIASDLSKRKQMEVELRHAQKLESIGQLAAGVAHEINTPMQFIGDNIHFLQESFLEILKLVKVYQDTLQKSLGNDQRQLAPVHAAEEQADLSYLSQRAPQAFDRTLDGVKRVSEIVAAMKAFSHPVMDLTSFDINEAINTTLIVAKNEYKYVATVETELGDIPHVTCQGNDINQVLLNIIVNASHAIIEKNGENSELMGRIAIKTWRDGDDVFIAITDTGRGIPKAIEHRIFDPFFTTKRVGQGTGQGLALSHTIVVEKHGGSLTFNSVENEGTTFTIRLPIEPVTK